MAYQFKRLTKGDTPIFSSGGYGFFRLSSDILPTPTTSLVYTLSSDSSYYIVGTGFTSEEAIEADTSGGTAGSGLDSTWSGGELVIPNTYNGKPVKAIAPKAFNAVRNITSVYIYDGITTFGHRCFQCLSQHDTAMTSCRLPNTLESFGGEAGRVFWGRQGLTRIDIPTSVTILEQANYRYCSALTSVDMSNVTSLGDGAFLATALTSVSMPNVTSIGKFVFEECPSLTSVSMPKVETIGEYAFNIIKALTSLTIPSTCTSIGGYALCCGSSTNKCTFTFEGTTPPSIQSNTFNASYINKIIVPKGCGETYKTATNWSRFADYIEEATA